MNANILQEVFRHAGRPTRAIVDLDAIAGNLAVERAGIGSNVEIMAVVKANAYGHGAIAVAQAAVAAGANHLAVATVDEAIQLRTASIRIPILVLGAIDDSEIDVSIGHSIDLAVGSMRFAQAVAKAADHLEVSSPVRVHLKIDTGMHRFGAYPDEGLEIARFLSGNPRLKLRGVYTHFAQADATIEQFTADQAKQLDQFMADLRKQSIQVDVMHEANSAAAIRSHAYDAGMVRLGIALYGLNPSSDVPIAPGMRPAMTIVSRIARIFDLATGDQVSYGGTFRAEAPMRAALVPIGYADGYPRALSNRSDMYVHDLACRVLGRVCMDQTVIALPEQVEACVGDAVIVAGAWENAAIMTFDDIASATGTINYEISSRVATRVPRYYLRSGKVVAISDLHGYRQLPQSAGGNR